LVLRCNRSPRYIGTDAPVRTTISSGSPHSHRLENQLPIGTLQSSSVVTSSNIRPPGAVCATMGSINPSCGSAHDHKIDRRSPSKHQMPQSTCPSASHIVPFFAAAFCDGGRPT
jgi:hypothetical protein